MQIKNRLECDPSFFYTSHTLKNPDNVLQLSHFHLQCNITVNGLDLEVSLDCVLVF